MSTRLQSRFHAISEKRRLLNELLQKEIRTLERNAESLTEIKEENLKNSNAYRNIGHWLSLK